MPSSKEKLQARREFAQMLIRTREQLGRSQSELAKLLDVTTKSLQNWEQEISMPQGRALKAITQDLAALTVDKPASASTAAEASPDDPSAPSKP